ncbi:MBL fold metallo-hydrolase [Vibrio parahaemolyticus]|uniref:MBL fold metallo-hydrolase n=1 Tax=Vibrio parahaemolyticus TaxID=670 RepID=UPI002AC494F3|nr:MBL fold metallo-hydrolase [Vibrio parahaemolyticus]EIS4856863.1 MBL fold metallo-hydrolase [Vibrio parahaemolyticus]EKB1964168.1 MBL fold metallo-hydrolase [Vibrio parahaemolyticus]MDZ5118412.1 MBL fold metallo-hydrolase [Vibrio parahaemolyticus]HCE4954583.1 MBL fold metallo-hydrolase [Vibrio parahaemolyticus]HCG5962420.1 MBL fold metallo-hydrolase [Vibrio parahaemolyticus]
MAEELKTVTLGRGTGECILVELEENNWMVIDCFNEPSSGRPAPIVYLEHIGLSAKDVIKKVVITHFHTDHVMGMHKLIQEIDSSASIYMSLAMTHDEAKKYYSEMNILNNDEKLSGVAEFCKIINYLAESGRKVIKVKQDTTLFSGKNLLVQALSPSEEDTTLAQNSFLALVTNSDSHPDVQHAKRFTPNHFCIALSIRCLRSDRYIVLGSDLEISKSDTSGWGAAMSAECAPDAGTIDVMKIAHHGSENGYHMDTWTKFTSDDVISLLTTFDRQKLPREDYIEVYKKHSKALLSTTKPKSTCKLDDVISKSSVKKVSSQPGFSVTVKRTSPVNQYGYIETFRMDEHFKYRLYGDAIRL